MTTDQLVRLTLEEAQAFVFPLNRNTIHDHEGNLVTFAVTPIGDGWTITAAIWADRPAPPVMMLISWVEL